MGEVGRLAQVARERHAEGPVAVGEEADIVVGAADVLVGPEDVDLGLVVGPPFQLRRDEAGAVVHEVAEGAVVGEGAVDAVQQAAILGQPAGGAGGGAEQVEGADLLLEVGGGLGLWAERHQVDHAARLDPAVQHGAWPLQDLDAFDVAHVEGAEILALQPEAVEEDLLVGAEAADDELVGIAALPNAGAVDVGDVGRGLFGAERLLVAQHLLRHHLH